MAKVVLVLPRPRLKLPIWAAFGIVGAAFVVRSLVIRGGDFTVEASDIAVVALVSVAGALVWFARRQQAAEEGEDQPDGHRQDEDRSSGDEG
jgi:hypothetical protein